MIQFDRVAKRFGSIQAVSDVSLSIEQGELFGLLGPNGAGKTTSIRMAAGMLEPSDGLVRVAGHDVYADGESARAITGYVPDQPYVYDRLTGREYIRFVASLYGVSRRDADHRAEDLVHLFDLESAADALAESYSHGMRQKLVITSVLVHRPQVILLDEPTTALDPRSARLVKEMLHAFCGQGGTVLLTTHVMEIAESMCDRVAIIDGGRIASLGTVGELRAHQGQDTLEDAFLATTGEVESPDWARILSGTDEP